VKNKSANQYDELARYFKSVSRTQMMSPDEELVVACKWRDSKEQRYADRLVSANLRFVIKIALEYKNYGFPVLDLIQEGNLGLVRAVKSFDPDKGFRLISYGVWWIRAYIQEFILKNWSLVKIGTTQLQRRLFNHMQSSQKRLQSLVGHKDEHTRREALAKAVGGSVRDVEEMERRLYGRDLSIDTPYSESDTGFSLSERLSSDDDNVEDLISQSQDRNIQKKGMEEALQHLDDRERHIVISRHLVDDTRTLRELGEELGISKERVRQLESRALNTLRINLRENHDVAASIRA
jgi:RNA polymerase sigma-32 factor